MTPTESDHYALDAIAGRIIDTYRAAVTDGASREHLAGILTGIAGCELAMSHTLRAMGEPALADSMRLAGLLLQEVGLCAAEGRHYRVRCPELDVEPAATALIIVALSYNGSESSRGRALRGLWRAVTPVLGDRAAEALVPIMAAHGVRWVRRER